MPKNYLFSKINSQEKSERLFYILNKRELTKFEFEYLIIFLDKIYQSVLKNRTQIQVFNKMLKLKSQLTCSYCWKIYKDPILFTCDDSICREHLSERDVVKQKE